MSDYLEQARRLARCPLERDALLTDAAATHFLAPKAEKASPYSVMLKFGVSTWPEAIALRAAANRKAKAEAEAKAAAEAQAQADADNADPAVEAVAA